MERDETKYCAKCREMVKTISETCPKCGRSLYYIYHKKEGNVPKKKLTTKANLAQARAKEKKVQKGIIDELQEFHKKAPLGGGLNPHMTI